MLKLSVSSLVGFLDSGALNVRLKRSDRSDPSGHGRCQKPLVSSRILVYGRILGKPLFLLRLENGPRVFFFPLFFSPFVHAWKSLSDSSLSSLFGSFARAYVRPLHSSHFISSISPISFWLAGSGRKNPFQFLGSFHRGYLKMNLVCMTLLLVGRYWKALADEIR